MLFDVQLDREISDRQIDRRVTIYAVWSTVRQRDIRQINRQKNQVTLKNEMKQRNIQCMNVKFCKVWHQFLNVKQIVASSWKKYCQMRAKLRSVMYHFKPVYMYVLPILELWMMNFSWRLNCKIIHFFHFSLTAVASSYKHQRVGVGYRNSWR